MCLALHIKLGAAQKIRHLVGQENKSKEVSLS